MWQAAPDQARCGLEILGAAMQARRGEAAQGWAVNVQTRRGRHGKASRDWAWHDTAMQARTFMPHDVPTQLLIRTFCDRFEPIELVMWAGRFRAERGCEPLTIWATIVDEICRPFVAQGVSTIVDLTTAAVRNGLQRIKQDREALAIRQHTPEDRRRFEQQAQQMKNFNAAETGQKVAKPKKPKPEDDGGLFKEVA